MCPTPITLSMEQSVSGSARHPVQGAGGGWGSPDSQAWGQQHTGDVSARQPCDPTGPPPLGALGTRSLMTSPFGAAGIRTPSSHPHALTTRSLCPPRTLAPAGTWMSAQAKPWRCCPRKRCQEVPAALALRTPRSSSSASHGLTRPSLSVSSSWKSQNSWGGAKGGDGPVQHTCTYVHTRMQTCTGTCMLLYMCLHMHAITDLHECTFIYVHTQVHAQICTNAGTHVCAHTHGHVPRLSTYTYTRIPAGVCMHLCESHMLMRAPTCTQI